jgi:hypothetical protein
MKWTLPDLREQTLENLGLIVSVLAALFAGWSGYEAHQARVSADSATRETIRLQREATQLDERPYVNVIPFVASFVVMHNPDRSSTAFLLLRLRVLTNGRTPALKFVSLIVATL